MDGQRQDLLTLGRMLMGLPGGERGPASHCGVDVARRHYKDTKHSPDPPELASLPASHFFLQPLGTHDWAPLSLGNTEISIENAIWIGAWTIQDRTG